MMLSGAIGQVLFHSFDRGDWESLVGGIIVALGAYFAAIITVNRHKDAHPPLRPEGPKEIARKLHELINNALDHLNDHLDGNYTESLLDVTSLVMETVIDPVEEMWPLASAESTRLVVFRKKLLDNLTQTLSSRTTNLESTDMSNPTPATRRLTLELIGILILARTELSALRWQLTQESHQIGSVYEEARPS